MKLKFKNQFTHNSRTLARACNYAEIYDRLTEKVSYTRRLRTEHYPRFHLYIEETPEIISFNLHLDQKKISYQGQSAHSGEYEGELVEQEIARIKVVLANYVRKSSEKDSAITQNVPEPALKAGIWEKFKKRWN